MGEEGGRGLRGDLVFFPTVVLKEPYIGRKFWKEVFCGISFFLGFSVFGEAIAVYLSWKYLLAKEIGRSCGLDVLVDRVFL